MAERIEVADSRFWVSDRKLHRDEGPAVEADNGTKEWWERGCLVGFSHRGIRRPVDAWTPGNGMIALYDDGPETWQSLGAEIQEWLQLSDRIDENSVKKRLSSLESNHA